MAASTDDLLKRNADLQAKIDGLKRKLGIAVATDAPADAEEKAKFTAIFNEFDVDRNGYIDANEFELLAFRCGSDLSALLPEAISKAFAQLNRAGDGRVTFEEFYEWLKASGTGGSAAAGGILELGLLRAKLQSKVWYKKFSELKGKSEDKKEEKKVVPAAAGEEKKASAGATAGAAASAPATTAAATEVKAATTGKLRAFNFQLAVGEIAPADVKAGIFITSREDPAQAAASRAAVSCPEDAPVFVYLDLGLREGFDEGEVGELVGALEALIGGLPFNALPIQAYHSHTVDLVPSERVIRICIFSKVDPDLLMTQIAVAQQAAIAAPEQAAAAATAAATSAAAAAAAAPAVAPDAPKLFDLFAGGLSIELPFGVEQMRDDAFRLSADLLKINVHGWSDVDPQLQVRAAAVLERLAPSAQKAMKTRLAMAKFFKAMDWTFKFSDLPSLLASVPDFDSDDNPTGRGPAAIQQLKAGIASASEVPVASTIRDLLAGTLAPMLDQLPPEMRGLYSVAQKNLLGLRRIHMQLNTHHTRIELRGLDVFSFFPAAGIVEVA